jgi:hypothetical protein
MFSLQNLPLNSTLLVEGVLENAPTFPSVSTVYPRFPHVFPANTRNYPCQGAVPNSLASTSLARWISFSGAMGNLLCAMVFLGTAVMGKDWAPVIGIISSGESCTKIGMELIFQHLTDLTIQNGDFAGDKDQTWEEHG